MKMYWAAVLMASVLATANAAAQELALSGASSDPAHDRASILAMQGDYSVDFAFDETVLLQPGYARAPAMRSGGNETVIVVEDTPTKIVLQHILVDDKSGHVTKHWRQDWTWQAASRFEFSAEQTWTVRALPAELTRGTWTQCVYEVSDAPRYCGTGKWTYASGVANWTSDLTARPLPRREYSKRSDYNVVIGINRHTLTPSGWTHEQFNTKTRRMPDGSRVELAREFGFNDYQKTTEVDFKPADEYWAKTSGYWAKLRARWDGLLSKPPGLHLKTKVDGMAMIAPLFGFADTLRTGGTVADTEIDAVFAKWVEPAGG
ncbi:MAG: DUF6607 family protein [Luteimonas sp.]